jgi:hypothetical protein
LSTPSWTGCATPGGSRWHGRGRRRFISFGRKPLGPFRFRQRCEGSEGAISSRNQWRGQSLCWWLGLAQPFAELLRRYLQQLPPSPRWAGTTLAVRTASSAGDGPSETPGSSWRAASSPAVPGSSSGAGGVLRQEPGWFRFPVIAAAHPHTVHSYPVVNAPSEQVPRPDPWGSPSGPEPKATAAPTQRRDPLHLVRNYQSLLDSGKFESRAALARYLGPSRASVTQVLRRLREETFRHFAAPGHSVSQGERDRRVPNRSTRCLVVYSRA